MSRRGARPPFGNVKAAAALAAGKAQRLKGDDDGDDEEINDGI